MNRWTVKIEREPKPGYFPRGFHYKREAEKVAQEVAEHGGQAKVEPTKVLS